MFLTRYGHHTGAAYSKMGLTNDLYNIEKVSGFPVPTVLFMIPKTLLALFVMTPTCLFHDKLLVKVTPKSLTLSTLFKDFPPRV